MSDEVKEYWRSVVLDHADQGWVSQRKLRRVTRPGKVYRGSGYDMVRALQEAYAKGFFEPPPFHAELTGKNAPAVLTEAGRRQLEIYRREQHEGIWPNRYLPDDTQMEGDE